LKLVYQSTMTLINNMPELYYISQYFRVYNIGCFGALFILRKKNLNALTVHLDNAT
jgi:hypothetical protein